MYCKTYDYEVDGEILFSVPYYQVISPNNIILQNQINEVLLQAAIEWLKDDCLWASNSGIEITCQTEDYFSYTYMHDMSDNSGTYCYGVTINMKKGTRLSLDDFLTIDDTFMEKLAVYDYNDEFVYPLSMEDAETMITSVLMTELEYLGANWSEGENVMGVMMYKSSFYIEPGELVIIRNTSGWADVYYSKIQMK